MKSIHDTFNIKPYMQVYLQRHIVPNIPLREIRIRVVNDFSIILKSTYEDSISRPLNQSGKGHLNHSQEHLGRWSQPVDESER